MICSHESLRPYPKGHNSEMTKIHGHLKIFSRTTGPILTKLVTKYSWVKRFQICSNEEPHHFPRKDNTLIAKIYCQHQKIFFSRTTGQIQMKHSTKHHWVKGLKGFLNEGP